MFVVIRLCTNEKAVLKYWDDIDGQLELDIDVLDDLIGEGEQVINIHTYIHTSIYTYFHTYKPTSQSNHHPCRIALIAQYSIYTYMHTYIHSYIHTTNTLMDPQPFKYTYIHTVHTYIHSYIHAYIHIYIGGYCSCPKIFIHISNVIHTTFKHTYINAIHTYVHTYIHTYILNQTYIHTYIHTITCNTIQYMQVTKYNPWLTYTEHIHRLREFGSSLKELG